MHRIRYGSVGDVPHLGVQYRSRGRWQLQRESWECFLDFVFCRRRREVGTRPKKFLIRALNRGEPDRWDAALHNIYGVCQSSGTKLESFRRMVAAFLSFAPACIGCGGFFVGLPRSSYRRIVAKGNTSCVKVTLKSIAHVDLDVLREV